MKDLIVIMGASYVRKWMPTYVRQLSRAGIEIFLIDIADRPNLDNGGTLGFRVKVFRELANQFSDYRAIVVTDAWDIQFFGRSAEQVIDRIPDDTLFHAAEKNCYPDLSLAPSIPDPGSAHRFVNGGMVAGTPKAFLEWCNGVEKVPYYDPARLDQEIMNRLLIDHPHLCRIDYRTELFFCLFGGYEELYFVSGRPVNKTFGTRPLFLHANGGCDPAEMLRKYEESVHE